MLKKLTLLICLSVLSSCSGDIRPTGLSQRFFSACDRGDFRLAYTLLSPADKRSISADSFCVMCSGLNNRIVRLDGSSAVSMFIERTSGDTSWVKQVWRVPDYALVRKSKPENVKFSDFFAGLDSEKAVPLRLDSSRTIGLLKEQGNLYVYLGLDRFKKFADSYRAIMGSYSFMVVVVPKKFEVYGTGRQKYSAEASVRIANYSPFLVSGFDCSISIDNESCDPDCNAFATTTVPAGRSVAGRVHLSEAPALFRKYLPNGSPSGPIKGERIRIMPTSVYFDSTTCAYMRNTAVKRSGFAGFRFIAPGYSKLLLDF